jgi:nitrite reductase/ring-hydroxylating ferredoxin subunit
MANFVKVASVSEITIGTGKPIEIGQQTVALFNVDGKFHCIHNTCKHRGGPLGEGDLEGTTVTCPWHGFQYDVTSGKCLTNPSIQVATFPVQIDGSDIKVAIE